MEVVRVEFRGSVVMFPPDPDPFLPHEALYRRTVEYTLGQLDRARAFDPFLRGRDCYVDSVRRVDLLSTIRGRIGANLREQLVADLRRAIGDDVAVEPVLTRRFAQVEGALLTAEERRECEERELARRQLQLPQVLRRLRKLDKCRRVFLMKTKDGLTLREIAAKLHLSDTAAAHLWREVKATRGRNIEQLEEEICERVMAELTAATYLAQNSANSAFLRRTLRQKRAALAAATNPAPVLKYGDFVAHHYRAGFRYRPLRYSPPAFRPRTPTQVRHFLEVALFFFLRPQRFLVLFVDESSVSSSNFLKKHWRMRGDSSTIRTKMRYERISLIGAISPTRLHALQVVHTGSSAQLFTSFMLATIRRAVEDEGDRRQVVVVLDNGPIHRHRDLIDFCEDNNVVLLFNLPSYCELNAIEFLWEVLKRPLRCRSSYRKWGNQRRAHCRAAGGGRGPNRTGGV